MKTVATPGPESSWADESATWTQSIGENFTRETPDEPGVSPGMADNPASLLPENPTAVPGENFDYTVDLPEGVVADSELLREFGDLARENNLPPETARKILNLEAKNVQRQLDAFTQQQSAWREEITSDPAFGGSRLDATVKNARKALDAYDPEGTLLPELNKTGYGNHPGIIRFLARVGGSLREDSAHHARGKDAVDTRPLRDRLWPD